MDLTHQKLRADFEAYLDGFSPNIQEILGKFKFRNQIQTLIESDILGIIIEKITNPEINLSPKPVLEADGNIRMCTLAEIMADIRAIEKETDGLLGEIVGEAQLEH